MVDEQLTLSKDYKVPLDQKSFGKVVLNCGCTDVSRRPHVCPNQDVAALAPQGEHDSEALRHLLRPGSLSSPRAGHVQRWEFAPWKCLLLVFIAQAVPVTMWLFQLFLVGNLNSLWKSSWGHLTGSVQLRKVLRHFVVLEVWWCWGAFVCVADTNAVHAVHGNWILNHGAVGFCFYSWKPTICLVFTQVQKVPSDADPWDSPAMSLLSPPCQHIWPQI